MSDDYRARVYGSYVTSRSMMLAPTSLEKLGPRAPFLQRIVRLHFPASKSAEILDLGCGYGAMVYFGHTAGYSNIRGVDGSVEQVALSQKLGIPNVKHADLIATIQAQGDQTLDMVIAFDVIEHFTKGELLRFLDHVHRVLKSGGRFLIHAPNAESPFGARTLYGDITHELAFTSTSINQLMMASGFRDVQCFEDVPVPHGLKSIIRWGLWKLIRSILRFYLVVETGDSNRKAIFSQNLLAIVRKEV